MDRCYWLTISKAAKYRAKIGGRRNDQAIIKRP